MANQYLFPEIIAITLQKYNYLDNKLYTLIKDNGNFKRHKGTILVKRSVVMFILKTYFYQELERMDTIPDKTLYKHVHSIHFIVKMMNEMKNLRWFQITLSKNATYSRICDFGGGDTSLNFEYKIIRGSFRTFDFFDQKVIPTVNSILKKVGVINKSHYSVVKLKHLEDRLLNIKGNSENLTEMEEFALSTMISYFSEWSEDNPQALIVTDFLDI